MTPYHYVHVVLGNICYFEFDNYFEIHKHNYEDWPNYRGCLVQLSTEQRILKTN